ncbi:MAG TPA: outer membrane beta-barrel protein, partial [Ignavibacteria bacterium]|nr:outer membrane beta-barrel protein [Ignavibacteria bacterium]
MRNKLCSLFIMLFVSFMVSNISYSQITLNFGPTIGASLPIGDYAGSLNDLYSLNKYGSSIGGNFGADAKLSLPYISAHAFINYIVQNRSGSLFTGSVDLNRNIFQVGFGPEAGFAIPKSNFKPYVGADFVMSVFTGKVTFTNVDPDINGDYSIAKETRYGFGFRAGMELKLPNFTIDINAKYSILNLMKRTFVSDTSRFAN